MSKIDQDTGGGCSICGHTPAVNVEGTYWLCLDCLDDKVSVKVMGFRQRPANFSPSRNLQDAWSVVDKIFPEGTTEVYIDNQGMGWECPFTAPDREEGFSGRKNSVEIAICVAALLYVATNKAEK